ncbi:hypothetical protein JEOAER750_01561 [Jeotgalicoccus aerolatus]|nr:YlaN family protein [Jeotgalicoccus aerolatus]NMA81147.1 YlaN family protein [Jeotgalicoccus aerolatus]GGD97972.1 UPF0358 protein [Jeotgalicoccus aerolatus]CAD2076912.1 hypothetical protein JEOAER750_01561 [Jeotgalicoccus aerolatus]HJG33155.1 YlaN family protein [Jeotgalicoccus aerolatus]
MSVEKQMSRVAYEQLDKDADRILQLIEVQMENLTMPQCPVFEEVLDTQMFGLSKEINFAVRLGLVDAQDGRAILDHLEVEVSKVHEAYMEREKNRV